MRFADPWWLALIPAVVALLWWRSRSGLRATVLFSRVPELRRLPRTTAQRVRRALPWMEGLGLVLLCLAMARPQSGREDSVVATEGIALQLVIDKSRSMAETDLDPDPWDRVDYTRLDVVKAVVDDFVDEEGALPGRPQDLVGLVSFAGFVQTDCPLTMDHVAFLGLLEGVEMPRVDPRDPAQSELLATAIGDALVVAVDRLSDVSVESKVIVLLSDGESNIGEASPVAGAEAAREAGIKVYAIGVGTPGSGLDAETLEEVADITGGAYINARDAAGLQRAYREIDELERTEITATQYTRWRERYLSLLVAGLALLGLHRLLLDLRFRSLP